MSCRKHSLQELLGHQTEEMQVMMKPVPEFEQSKLASYKSTEQIDWEKMVMPNLNRASRNRTGHIKPIPCGTCFVREDAILDLRNAYRTAADFKRTQKKKALKYVMNETHNFPKNTVIQHFLLPAMTLFPSRERMFHENLDSGLIRDIFPLSDDI